MDYYRNITMEMLLDMDVSVSDLQDLSWLTLERFGYLFYIVSPKKTTFETVEEVPDLILQVLPCFLVLNILEKILINQKGKFFSLRALFDFRAYRINDVYGNLSQGVFAELMRVLLEGWKLAAYVYVYTNWRLVTLPWESLWTWIIAFVVADFAFYWAHRASHEINFMWAAHQVHHSSEDYNLSSALRQSIFQYYFMWVINLVPALCIPPAQFLVHHHLNLLYQFSIHTELVKSLGPLEYVLNTPSHHRVHHGRNRYCIDKNYGGVLIIWDRLFRTFEPESEKVVYGVTHPINSFESFQIQLCHFKTIWRTFRSVDGWRNKLSVLFKGPGWAPGKPRLGNLEDIPDVKAPAKKYDPAVPLWCMAYMAWHFTLLTLAYTEMSIRKQVIPAPILYGIVAFEIYSISSLGHLMDGRPFVIWLELFRCALYVAVDYYFVPWTRLLTFLPIFPDLPLQVVRATFALSGVLWFLLCLRSVTIRLHKKL